ncbi:MAG: hypothetical protein AAF413_00825 [Patescibacteria group bacterium]
MHIYSGIPLPKFDEDHVESVFTEYRATLKANGDSDAAMLQVLPGVDRAIIDTVYDYSEQVMWVTGNPESDSTTRIVIACMLANLCVVVDERVPITDASFEYARRRSDRLIDSLPTKSGVRNADEGFALLGETGLTQIALKNKAYSDMAIRRSRQFVYNGTRGFALTAFMSAHDIMHSAYNAHLASTN